LRQRGCLSVSGILCLRLRPRFLQGDAVANERLFQPAHAQAQFAHLRFKTA
jgi:hypothetical protein